MKAVIAYEVLYLFLEVHVFEDLLIFDTLHEKYISET